MRIKRKIGNNQEVLKMTRSALVFLTPYLLPLTSNYAFPGSQDGNIFIHISEKG
jgi:hypothetical protein